MIEREFIKAKMKELQVMEYITETLKNVGHSHTNIQKPPLGEKVIIHTSRPGLVVGRKGQNISSLTKILKSKFKLDNPQVEISEVENPDMIAQLVAEKIVSQLERFGPNRFKAILHRAIEDTMSAGALGIEIVLSGKVPSSRAKSWRVFSGYLKKCGHIAQEEGDHATASATLKAGVVGVKVSIMSPDVNLPDHVRNIKEKPVKIVEEADLPGKKDAGKEAGKHEEVKEEDPNVEEKDKGTKGTEQ